MRTKNGSHVLGHMCMRACIFVFVWMIFIVICRKGLDGIYQRWKNIPSKYARVVRHSSALTGWIYLTQLQSKWYNRSNCVRARVFTYMFWWIYRCKNWTEIFYWLQNTLKDSHAHTHTLLLPYQNQHRIIIYLSGACEHFHVCLFPHRDIPLDEWSNFSFDSIVKKWNQRLGVCRFKCVECI